MKYRVTYLILAVTWMVCAYLHLPAPSNEPPFWYKLPAMTIPEIRAEVTVIEGKLSNLGTKTWDNAMGRFNLIRRSLDLSLAVTRGDYEYGASGGYRVLIPKTYGLKNAIHNAYTLHFDAELMQATADEWNRLHPEGFSSYRVMSDDRFMKNTGIFLLWGIPFSLLGLLVRCEQRRVRAWWLQLVNPRYWLAGLLWPVGWFIYPDEEVFVEFRRALNTAAGFLIAAVSCCFGGGPMAKKHDPQKGKQPWMLQMDLRAQPKFAGTPPYPEREYFLRMTVRSPSGFNFENVLQRDSGGWNDSFTFGRRFVVNEATSLIPVIGVRNTSSGLHSPILGVQLYGSVPKVGLNLAVPAIQWEPRVKNTALIDGFLMRPLSANWSAGAEGAVRFNREVKSWKIVPLLQRKIGRLIAELGLPIHDGDKVWMRGRLIWNVR